MLCLACKPHTATYTSTDPTDPPPHRIVTDHIASTGGRWQDRHGNLLYPAIWSPTGWRMGFPNAKVFKVFFVRVRCVSIRRWLKIYGTSKIPRNILGRKLPYCSPPIWATSQSLPLMALFTCAQASIVADPPAIRPKRTAWENTGRAEQGTKKLESYKMTLKCVAIG